MVVVVVERYVMELLVRVRERKVQRGKERRKGLIFTLPDGVFI